jgi:hypothetical protein
LICTFQNYASQYRDGEIWWQTRRLAQNLTVFYDDVDIDTGLNMPTSNIRDMSAWISQLNDAVANSAWIDDDEDDFLTSLMAIVSLPIKCVDPATLKVDALGQPLPSLTLWGQKGLMATILIEWAKIERLCTLGQAPILFNDLIHFCAQKPEHVMSDDVAIGKFSQVLHDRLHTFGVKTMRVHLKTISRLYYALIAIEPYLKQHLEEQCATHLYAEMESGNKTIALLEKTIHRDWSCAIIALLEYINVRVVADKQLGCAL